MIASQSCEIAKYSSYLINSEAQGKIMAYNTQSLDPRLKLRSSYANPHNLFPKASPGLLLGAPEETRTLSWACPAQPSPGHCLRVDTESGREEVIKDTGLVSAFGGHPGRSDIGHTGQR